MNATRFNLQLAALIVFHTATSQSVFSQSDSTQHNWPLVQPVHEEYNFPDASRAALDLNLKAGSGQVLYTLHCRTGALGLEPGKAILLPRDPPFWGEFACHLHSRYERDRYESLLIEDPFNNDASRSRGEFFSYQLQGSCEEYPDWGRTRSFRLRGMRLQLELTNIEFGAKVPLEHFKSFGLKVDVTPDMNALSSISEPPAFANPPAKLGDPYALQCDHPMRSHVAGVVTEQYVRDMGLSPPYSAIVSTSKRMRIDLNRQGYVGPPSSGKFVTEPMGRFATLQVDDPDGRPAYTFECLAYRIVGKRPPMIAGDGLTCGLFLPGEKANLLLDSVDPYSRMSPAVILPKQLQGAAGNDPEWGNTRHFSLRGLCLTLVFANSAFHRDEFGNPALVSSDLTIEIKADPSAQSPVAKAPSSSFKGFFSDAGVGQVQ